jgi:uncharacterized membrane protein YecN with MAPEG domain
MLPITSLYAGILGLVLLVLSFRVIAVRRSARISLGAGGNPVLERRIRSHANFCEFAPLILLLLALAELGGAMDGTWLYALGGALVVGRVAHPFGIEGAGMNFRLIGMISTFSALIGLSLGLLVRALG